MQFILNKILFFLLFTFLLSCNENKENIQFSPEEIKKTIDSATIFLKEGNFEESERLFKKLETKGIFKENDSLKITFLFNYSELIKKQGNYEKSLQNYFEALGLSKKEKNDKRIGLANYNIATVYYLLNKPKSSEKYLNDAISFYSKANELNKIADCYVVLSSLFRKNKKLDKAKNYLNKAIEIYSKKTNSEINLSICFNNLGNILQEEKKFNKAIQYYTEASKINKKINDEYGLSIRYGNIAEAYLTYDKLNIAKKYIDSSQVIAKKLEAKETIFLNLERLITYYKKKKQYQNALETSEELRLLKINFIENENSNIIKNVEETYKNKIALNESISKNEILKRDALVAQKKLEKTRLYILLIALISLFTIFYLINNYLKQKKLRNKENEIYNKELELLKSKNNIERLMKEKLEKELYYKKNELISFSINLSEKENLMTELKTVFSKINSNKTPDTNLISEIKTIFQKGNIETSNEINKQIEKINSSFYFKLKDVFPNLTDDDLRLSSLILLGLNSKEISTILSIESKSVDMKKYRLKKKLDLDQNTDIKDFLLKL